MAGAPRRLWFPRSVNYFVLSADTEGMWFRLFFLMVLLPWAALGAGDCRTHFAAMSYARLPQPPLEELVRASGLNPEQVELLRRNSAGVLGIEEFLKIRGGLGRGYLLAKDGIRSTELLFSSPRGLRHWKDGYASVGMQMRWKHPDPAQHTPEFLARITEKNEPIVFLVPPGLFPGSSGFTRAEMRWALENPDRLRPMIFVFGAYDFLPQSALDEFGRTHDLGELRKYLEP